MKNIYPLIKAETNIAPGTHFLVELEATYKQLVDLLGKPHYDESGDGKVQAEWHFTVGTKGDPVTIYDYKSGCPKEEVTEWHIGGNKLETGIWVKTILEDLLE